MFLPDNSEYKPVENPDMTAMQTKNHRLDMEHRLSSYDEIDQTYTEEEALLEASRCLHCPTHWCQNACPAGVPVADFIARIREKDYEGAYRLISTASSLPEMCSRLCPQEKQCQSNCTRGICSESVAIGRLERFVADWYREHVQVKPADQTQGKRIAVVGAGPGGLAAARKLAYYGYRVTVYDREKAAGGLLYAGIPNMKLEKNVLEDKIRQLRDLGIEFQCGTEVDAAKAKELKEAFDAVVLAVGTGEARMPVIQGADQAKGICYAVDYLASNTKALLAPETDSAERISAKDRHVIIVGGGDTGNDCVGMAIRNGCRSITQVEMMPERTGRQTICYPYTVKQAASKFDCSQEECLNVFCKDPHRYATSVHSVKTDEAGNVVSATLVKMELRISDDGRRIMQMIPGTEEEVPCDLLIIAAGFIGPKQQIKTDFQVTFTGGYQTTDEKVFCCGDCRTGQSLVVKAMTDGQKCAETVHEFLTKGN